ncbi:hypothetical protein CCANI_11075 [Corynebacterium canis]|nr:hypothetical protein CCANI_11075 [Corynebacterium canis]
MSGRPRRDGLCATALISRAAMGCAQPPTWGSSFYSSFGGLTKKFRTNLAQKGCKSSFYSSFGTPMKKFRTIAGQRLHTTYPERAGSQSSQAVSKPQPTNQASRRATCRAR